MRNSLLKYETEYFKNYTQVNASLVLGLIVISLGLYMIPWIYIKNREFEGIDKDAPDSRRGFVVLVMVPFFWAYAVFVCKTLIMDNLAVEIVEIVGWGFAIFLILKYLFDFCMAYARITRTNGFLWFLLFFIPFLTIPAMQAELNSKFNRMHMKRTHENFYR